MQSSELKLSLHNWIIKILPIEMEDNLTIPSLRFIIQNGDPIMKLNSSLWTK